MTTCWDLAETAVLAKAPRLLIWGPKGLAKSRWAQDILAHSHSHVSQCSLNEDIAAQELLGHYIPKGSVFEWHDGPVMMAYRGGGGLVVNEIARASGAVQDMFLAVLDDPSVSKMALPSGENVTPGKAFQVISTSNANPESMDGALYDRFDAIIQINCPHPALIAHLNQQRKGLGTIVARSYQDKNKVISPRRALAFLSFVFNSVPEDIAAQLAFGPLARDIQVALAAVPVAAGE